MVGLARVVASGITDSTGTRTLAIPAPGEYQLIARHLGYQRASQFLAATAGTSVARMQMSPAVTTIAGVTVSARTDPLWRSRHIGADEIAASERPILDGLDVLRKLRPQMLDPKEATGYFRCQLDDIFVNGQHVRLVPPNDRLEMEKRQMASAMAMIAPISGGQTKIPPLEPRGILATPLDVLAVLASIQPEHIDEITYVGCRDTTINTPHGRNAVYVALKRGVQFEPGVGSHVVQSNLVIAANRLRIVGVFDDVSGEPINGAEIVDPASGTRCSTSETGTASLAFLPDGRYALRVRKAGYAEQRLDVVISEAEMSPITLLLHGVSRE